MPNQPKVTRPIYFTWQPWEIMVCAALASVAILIALLYTNKWYLAAGTLSGTHAFLAAIIGLIAELAGNRGVEQRLNKWHAILPASILFSVLITFLAAGHTDR